MFVSVCFCLFFLSFSGDVSGPFGVTGELRGSRLEAWMKSHKSEVAIT